MVCFEQGDCDYTSCGSSYPTGTIDVEAARITSPATMSLNSTVLSDRDGDTNVDTAEIEFNILSNAFFEDLDVEIQAKNASGVVLDTIETRVQAGGGVDVHEILVHRQVDRSSFIPFDDDRHARDVIDTVQTGANS